MNRLMITGTHSGCGKTTVTCAVLAALKARGLAPVAFKCGPDYIDPTFHRAVAGVRAYNIDPFFLGEDAMRAHLALRSGEIAVMEGAMGYYDGIAATDTASAYSVASATGAPAVLVLSARGAENSLGAVMEGFARHKTHSHIAGVIYNGAGGRRYPYLEGIARRAGLRAYGYLPHNAQWTLPSRHLGLLSAGETDNIRGWLSSLGQAAEQTLDMDGLIALAHTAAPLPAAAKSAAPRAAHSRLAVARDEAFCFMYEENTELLREAGCEPVYFSPMRDAALPPNVQGLYLCGGYPELHAKALCENARMRQSVREAVLGGMPAIAEGGGFIYLHRSLDGLPMCGVIDGDAFKTARLQRFGYATLTASRDNLLCRAGGSTRSQEFHFWDSTCRGDGFTAQKAEGGEAYPCAHAGPTLYAGFPQLYLPAAPAFAHSFARGMSRYRAGDTPL